MSDSMEFEWDEGKRRANIAKHGIDFEDAKEVFSDPAAYTVISPRPVNERRYLSVGLAKGALIAVINTRRGEVLRIISARATRRSERQYYGGEVAKEKR
jgi:uncharacterized protein